MNSTFFLLIALFVFMTSTATADIVSGGDGSDIPIPESGGQYYREMNCVLGKLAPNADSKQRERAMHFAKTLGELTAGWQPQLAKNWRRHIYAQFAPETNFFKLNEEQPGADGKFVSKLPDGDMYHGRGWIQITHKANYGQFACFKQALNSAGGTSSLDQLENLARTRSESCNYQGIRDNPEKAFKYTDGAETEENKNNDLSAIWYFLMKGKEEQPAFPNAIESTGPEAVGKVRKAVNTGSVNSKTTPNGLKEAQDAYTKIESCF